MKFSKKILFLTFAIAIVSVNSCKKQFIDPVGVSRFAFSNDGCIKKDGDILVFSDWETFMNTMEEFEKLEKEYYENLEKDNIANTPNSNQYNTKNSKNSGEEEPIEDSLDLGSPVLTAFENKYNHLSLRRYIVNEENRLLANGTFSQYNDPDNHFISDPYIRTVLNTDLEIKIGDTYYKFIDEFKYVRTKDRALLNQIRMKPVHALCEYPQLDQIYIKQPTEGYTGGCPGRPMTFDDPIIFTGGIGGGRTICVTNFSIENIQDNRVDFKNLSSGITSVALISHSY
jgi:hypothetical protein